MSKDNSGSWTPSGEKMSAGSSMLVDRNGMSLMEEFLSKKNVNAGKEFIKTEEETEYKNNDSDEEDLSSEERESGDSYDPFAMDEEIEERRKMKLRKADNPPKSTQHRDTSKLDNESPNQRVPD